MKRYYNKESGVSKFFQILVIALCVGIFIFGIVSVGSLFEKKDAYEDINLKYDVGEIISDSTGAGVVGDCTNALYSKEAVECTGFVINTSFDTRTDYEVHYYAADKTYIGYVTVSDVQYSVDVGEMPVLKEYVGDINSNAYTSAADVLDDNDNKITAAYIRIVIRPMQADSDIFSGLSGWFNKARFSNALELKATTKTPTAES